MATLPVHYQGVHTEYVGRIALARMRTQRSGRADRTVLGVQVEDGAVLVHRGRGVCAAGLVLRGDEGERAVAQAE